MAASPSSTPRPGDFQDTPSGLKHSRHWVLRIDKQPCNPGGKSKGWDEPEFWLTFQEALDAYMTGMFTGIGFIIAREERLEDKQIIGIDLDCCRDPISGEMSEWAKAILNRLDSYAEITPSKCGYHIWLYGKLPVDSISGHGPDDLTEEMKANILEAKPEAKKKLEKGEPVWNGLEVYEDGPRHFTVTGMRLAEYPAELQYRAAEILEVISPFQPESEEASRGSQPESNPTLDDFGPTGNRLPPLDILDVIDTTGFTKTGSEFLGPHPTLGSTTGKNLKVNVSKQIWSYMHNKAGRSAPGGDAWIWLAVECGAIPIEKAGSGALKDPEVLRKVKQYAVEKGYFTEEELFTRPKMSLSDALQLVADIKDKIKDDPGLPFELRSIEALATVKRGNRAEYERVRAALKAVKAPIREIEKTVDKKIANDKTREDAERTELQSKKVSEPIHIQGIETPYDPIVKLSAEPSPKELALWHLEKILVSCPENQIVSDASNPDVPYLWLSNGGHRELMEIEGQKFAEYLAGIVLSDVEHNPLSKSLSMPIIRGLMPTIKYIAYRVTNFKKLPIIVDMAPRIMEINGAIWYDLGTPEWVGVEITPGNVSIGPLPVGFIRRKSMKAQVIPDLSASSEDALDLMDYFNMAEEYQLVSIVFTVNCYLPSLGGVKIPKPILSLDGGSGSGKSSTAREIVDLTDPDTDPEKKLPKNDKDLAVNLREHFVMIIDNVSELEQWFQDMLCQSSTGGASTSRTLYTNTETTTARFNSRVILTSISTPYMETDLKDRTLFCHTLQMADDDQRSLVEMRIEFEEKKPRILGGILKTAAKALEMLPEVIKESESWENKPRLLDFARIGEACARVWGYDPGYFLEIYNRMRTAESSDLLKGVHILKTFRTFIKAQPGQEWEGLISDLYDKLCIVYKGNSTYAPLPDKWPAGGTGLGKLLSKYSQDLLKLGYKIERSHEKDGNHIKVIYSPVEVKDEKQPSPTPHLSFTDKNDSNNSSGEGLKGNINTFKDIRNFRDKRCRAKWLTARDDISSRKEITERSESPFTTFIPSPNDQKISISAVKDEVKDAERWRKRDLFICPWCGKIAAECFGKTHPHVYCWSCRVFRMPWIDDGLPVIDRPKPKHEIIPDMQWLSEWGENFADSLDADFWKGVYRLLGEFPFNHRGKFCLSVEDVSRETGLANQEVRNVFEKDGWQPESNGLVYQVPMKRMKTLGLGFEAELANIPPCPPGFTENEDWHLGYRLAELKSERYPVMISSMVGGNIPRERIRLWLEAIGYRPKAWKRAGLEVWLKKAA